MSQFYVASNGLPPPPGSLIELTPDIGGAVSPDGTGNINVISNVASNNSGQTVLFSGTANTLTLNVTDINLNTCVGNLCGAPTMVGGVNSIFGSNNCVLITTANNTTVIGNSIFNSLTSGPNNIGIGWSVGHGNGPGTYGYNIFIGNTTGVDYTTTESSNILINNAGTIGDNHVIRIGTQGSGNSQQNKVYISGITGVTVSNSKPVVFDTSTGQLGEGSGGTKTTVYLANNSWTLDPRTTFVDFIVTGGGGGGGSGRCGVSTASGGGGGGAAGYTVYQRTAASLLLASPYTITVGTGGAGGISVNAVTTNGNPGMDGNPSSVGSFVLAAGGFHGAAGIVGTANGGSTGINILGVNGNVGTGGSGTTSTVLAATQVIYGYASGGGGGCGYATTTARTGAAGGAITDSASTTIIAGGLAGDNLGNTAGMGNAPGVQSLLYLGGTGGGGGGHDGTTVAGGGGNGAQPGGGGGGGAGNLSSNASGAGGNGGNGRVIIVEYF